MIKLEDLIKYRWLSHDLKLSTILNTLMLAALKMLSTASTF